MSAPAHTASETMVHPDPAHAPDDRPRNGPEASGEADLIAGLWQEAPFARLPVDAPVELKALIQDIENPNRVYAIHRAKRRHDFQFLVERYLFQLRNGCGVPKCSTATCFTFRKRLAGKAPIRRYNPTSARTLAVYLASQSDPENGFCPYLGLPKEPPPAVSNLIFSARPNPTTRQSFKGSDIRAPSTKCKAVPHHERRPSQSSQKRKQSIGKPDIDDESDKTQCAGSLRTSNPIDCSATPRIMVTEKHVPKDYRSFAVATFGTVAFKMLEWLTPPAIDSMSEKISELGGFGQSSTPADEDANGHDAASPSSLKTASNEEPKPPARATNGFPKVDSDVKSLRPNTQDNAHEAIPSGTVQGTKEVRKTKRKSKATLRSSPSKSSHRRSLESVSITPGTEENKPSAKHSSLNGFYPEKLPRTTKTTAGLLSRGLLETPAKPAVYENIPSPTSSTEEVDVDLCEADNSEKKPASEEDHCPAKHENIEIHRKPKPVLPALESDLELVTCLLPQSLSILNVELVDFICDIFQEDHTSETQFFGPLEAYASYPKPQAGQRKLARSQPSSRSASATQWKAFNEQTIFNVLSDPVALYKSFSQDNSQYDSHTLWYCMHRLTRAAPSLVLHSLWIAAESLFDPPAAINALRPTPKNRKRQRAPLSDSQAGCIMSICLHALVAAAPFVADATTLIDMSRIRSTGLTLGGNGVASRPSRSLCLEYDDVFSNETAIRLARRLFSAISARRLFAELAVRKDKDEGDGLDILQPLLDQLDFHASRSDGVLEFAHPERQLHDTRVPTLLLDWARAVLLNEWNGNPEITNCGPFHGALSLLETMYENRNILPLDDKRFRLDFFSDRLDAMEMPVAWADFVSTKEKSHILDYPYLFSPEALVTFFRSINFSRMSRMFEESSSLKTRMNAIVDPGSLITNPHHKVVLQDMLKTASSKYFVLDIARDNVLRDAFDQLWRRQQRELLRPLKVHLGEDGGEEGFDSGGVQQEFFRIAIAECLDPQYGAFTVDERTRMTWFVPGSIVEEWKFELIGILVSLAVYNGLTLPVTFPKALYRKLLGEPVEELYHIADGWPDLASGLMTLLEWNEQDGLVEDVFARTYEFSVPGIGGNVTRPMTRNSSPWPQGLNPSTKKVDIEHDAGQEYLDQLPLVTNDNRDEYVSDYIRYLTDVSIQPQFRAFERGFRRCLVSKSLSLLSPQILQSVVEGVQEIDILELRRYARYVGWDASHHTVRDFWSIVRRYDDRMKRKLLEFVTASDRVPVGGMRNLQFVIQKNGEVNDVKGHLPTAYTCYGTLLLPEYRDREVLRERMAMALENAQGFGFA